MCSPESDPGERNININIIKFLSLMSHPSIKGWKNSEEFEIVKYNFGRTLFDFDRRLSAFPSYHLSWPFLKECLNTVSENRGFCVADFATLSGERRSRSKIFLLFICIKEPCVRKFEGLARSKILGISQTKHAHDTLI